jgi:environmental stress-induced protein Ves
MASLEDAFMELTRDSVEFHVRDDADDPVVFDGDRPVRTDQMTQVKR